MLVALVGSNIYTYQALTKEVALGEIAFRQIGEQQFEADLTLQGAESSAFVLSGDEWQLSVRMLKWKSWMTWLGSSPLYRLDRISGRYEDIEQEKQGLRTVYSLADVQGVDIWKIAREYKSWWTGVDAIYGSAVFLPMQDGAVYRVSMTSSGLIARPGNQTASALAAR